MTAVRSCRGGMRRSRVRGLVVGIVVMVVGRWERVVALAGAAVLLCRFLVGGRVWRRGVRGDGPPTRSRKLLHGPVSRKHIISTIIVVRDSRYLALAELRMYDRGTC